MTLISLVGLLLFSQYSGWNRQRMKLRVREAHFVSEFATPVRVKDIGAGAVVIPSLKIPTLLFHGTTYLKLLTCWCTRKGGWRVRYGLAAVTG